MSRIFAKRILSVTLAMLFTAGSLAAAPVLTNGDFEANPPPNMGDNIGWSAAPWVIGGGVTANIIKVDGAGSYTYGTVPALEQDATNPGAGIAQHYLDVVGGTNSFYQPFTPLCSGEVTYGAAFSTVEGYVGDAGIEIQLDSDGSVVAPRQVTAVPGGNTASNPWTNFSFTTTLTANTTYRFVADLNDWVVMDNAFVQFNAACPAHDDTPIKVNTTKTCAAPQMQADGTVTLACEIEVDFPNGPPVNAQGDVYPVTISDAITLNGAATTMVMQGAGNDPWVCGPGFAPTAMGLPPVPVALSCGLDATSTAVAASSSADGMAGMSVISTTTTFPAGSMGSVENCAYSAYYAIPDLPTQSPPSCVTIDLPKPHPHDPIKPVACEAFTTEVTCDAVSGKPVVTLKNKLSNIFNASTVNVTSQTPGVTVQQSKADPLQILLSGAAPGDTVLLMTDAVAKGKGSKPGLDLCCEGPIKVEIPKGFVCEAKAKLEVSKTCETDVKSTVGANAECEITVHYEGPAPKASNPIVVTEAVTGSPWAFTTTPLSGDNWSCPAVPDATPFTCTISAASEPAANWSNWTSTIIVQMNAGEAFENCITAKTGGLEDKACWSTETPELTIAKTADQAQCVAGQPCTFTIAVTNISTTSTYNGPISLGDQIANVSPPVLAGNGVFTSIAPPLCAIADLNSGLCSGNVSLGAGAVQSYSVTWIPPGFASGEDEKVLVTNCVDLAWQGSRMHDANFDHEPLPSADRSCADVVLLPPDLDIVKTGPDLCLPGQPCDYKVTISTINGFNGPVLLTDDAPAGFQITAITPAPVGCGANLPANPLACVIPVSLSAGGSQSYTISITPVGSVMENPSLGAENCASLRSVSEGASPADYSFAGDVAPEGLSDLVAGGAVIYTSCAPVDWPWEEANISVEKRFLQAECAVGGACDFELVITNQSATQAYNGSVAITDNMTPAGYIVTGMSPAVCTPVPTAAPFDCAATVSLPPGATQIVTVTGFVPFGVVPAGQSQQAQNCANAAPVAQGSIAPWPANLFDTTKTTCAETMVCGFACHMNEVEAGKLNVEKVLLNPETCVPGGICTYGITVTNTSTTPMFSPITLLETPPSGAVMVAVRSLPWSCGPKASGLSCVHPPITLNSGDSTAFEIDMAIGADFAGTEITNCVGFETASGVPGLMRQISPDPLLQLLEGGSEAGLVEYLQQRGISAEGAARLAPAFVIKANGAAEIGSGQQSCVSKTLATANIGEQTLKTAPALTVTKTSTGPCVVNEAAQTYACDFDLTVTNAGGDFSGPLVVGDAFDRGMVSEATGQGAGWSCSTSGDAASCINGNLALPSGASDTVQLSLAVKGLAEGGSFQNCASIGASDNPTQQAMIVQTALSLMGVDIGAVDGKIGKRTRAAVVDLQEQLGLTGTGEIDDALLQALGVPMAAGADPSCVTVDLPPMPRPRLICDKATTTAVDGACACRYKNMYQADDQSCGCVKGFSFVAGEGCIKRKVKDPVKDPVKPKGVKCDAKTTVLRNGVCECREEGMLRKNATSCTRQKVRQELKICPNGLPAIPGIGCVDIKIGGGGGKKEDAVIEDPVKTDRPIP